MNLAEFAIKKSVIILVFTFLLVMAGFKSYQHLPRLEDPEFTVKQATIMTPYPGASAREVEEEISNVIEKAVQEMGQLDYVESKSTRGLSTVKVFIKDQYDKFALPQVWDELRRKIDNYQNQLPPGAGPSIVNDDFGDVYGVYLALTGNEYSYAELRDTAEFLKRELLQAQDVKKITFYGELPEVIYVEMNREKMAQLGISQEKIYDALKAKNIPADAGRLKLGKEWIPLNPTGEFKSEQEFGDLLISSKGTDRLIYLKDVAQIKRGYKDPASFILRYNGKPAVGIGVSTILGGNVVTMGSSLEKRLREITPQIPLGMKLEVIYFQPQAVTKAVNDFVISLAESVTIVFVVLLIFMGLRSGLIIGAVLVLTIGGTFIFMDMWHVTLERISLGALIIALGMLVDNAIVVTDGMRIRMEQGMDALAAAKEVVGQTSMPLLGATVVAVTAFAAIGTSQDSTGEYCRTLFQVILISLMFSWVTAVTITPLFCKMFFVKKQPKAGETPKDPYAAKGFQIYKKFLLLCLHQRWIAIGVTCALFFLSLVGFKKVDKSFFPNSTTPQYFVNFWLPEGSHVDETVSVLKTAEDYFKKRPEAKSTVSIIGGGEVRFLLTYPTEMPSQSYGQILVTVNDYKQIDSTIREVQKELQDLLPDVTVIAKKFLLGPGEGGKIQIRISGPDYDTVRKLGDQVKAVLYEDGNAMGIVDNWREKVKVIRPQLAEAQARRLGIERPEVARTLQAAFLGTKVGTYREGDEFLDIVARAPEAERTNVDNLNYLQIWSPAEQKMIPMGQIVHGFDTVYEDANIWRRSQKSTMTIHADPVTGLASKLLERIKPKVEKALNVEGVDKFKPHTAKSLPVTYKNEFPIKDMPGYSMGWDGEAEDSAKANTRLGASIPVFFCVMVIIVICLFNALRQPLVIWLTVPLAMIGVTAGLLFFKQPFSFMALLGFLSLSGMQIKNAIVLIDEMDCQIRTGKDRFQAVVDSGISRIIPVSMAAFTTVLGMIPLLQDAFFVPMAVTIMCGLAFAAVLTLVIVPVLYALFFRIPYDRQPI
jgi:multidrug efflux pump subunit AcrB